LRQVRSKAMFCVTVHRVALSAATAKDLPAAVGDSVDANTSETKIPPELSQEHQEDDHDDGGHDHDEGTDNASSALVDETMSDDLLMMAGRIKQGRE
jgi:hypothetical protein